MGDPQSFSRILRAFLIASLVVKGAESCRRGWLVYRGFCYGVFQEKKTWADAEVDCHRMGAHLASIHSTEESVKVSQYVSMYVKGQQNVWIGLHIPAKNKPWTWVDHTKFCFSSWKTGEPNNFVLSLGSEDCVELDRSLEYLRWNDVKCTAHRAYLCKQLHIPKCFKCQK